MFSVVFVLVLSVSADQPPLTPFPGPLGAPASGVGGGGGGSGTFLRLDGTNAMTGTAAVNATTAGGINFGGTANASITYDAILGLQIQSPTTFSVRAAPNEETWFWQGGLGFPSISVNSLNSLMQIGATPNPANVVYQFGGPANSSVVFWQPLTLDIGTNNNRASSSTTPVACFSNNMNMTTGTDTDVSCVFADGGWSFGAATRTNLGSVESTLPFLAGNGTAGAPSFAFATEPDTGMLRAAANQIGWSAGGSTVMTLSQAILDLDSPTFEHNITTTGSVLHRIANPSSASSALAILQVNSAAGNFDIRSNTATAGGTGSYTSSQVQITTTLASGMLFDLSGTAGNGILSADGDTLTSERFRWNSSGVVVNENSGNADFRVETDNNANAIAVNSDTTSTSEGVGFFTASTAGNVDLGLHVASHSATPSSVTTGTCSSETVSGTDTRGTITATCAINETIILTFGDSYNSAPHCIWSESDADAVTDAFFLSATSTATATWTASVGGVSPAVISYWCSE